MYRGSVSVLVVAVGTVAFGQTTQVDLRTQSKSVDFSGAATTKPIKSGTALPPTCSTGELFWLTNAAPGANIYGCTSTNTWSVEGGSVTLGGDLSGSGAATEVVGLRGRPVSSAAPSSGEALVWNAADGSWEPQVISTTGGGIAPGAQFESGLGDFAMTRVSNIQVSLAANSGGTAVRCGNAVTLFTGSVTITAATGSLSSGAALYPYVDCTSSPATVKVDSNAAVTTGHLTLTGATFGNSSATTYPPDSIPLPKITAGMTTDQFDANPFTDYRSFLSTVVVRCGANLVRTVGGDGSYTCAVDPTSTLAWTGVGDFSSATLTKTSRFAGADPSSCSEGESYYNTTSHMRKDCTGTNNWQASSGLLTFQGATQPIAITGGKSTTIYSGTVAAGAIQAGGCITVETGWQSSTVGTGTITPTLTFGSASVSLYAANNFGDNMTAAVDICNLPGYTNSQQINERVLMLSSRSATGVPAYTAATQNTQQPVAISIAMNGNSSSGFAVSGLWFKVTRN